MRIIFVFKLVVPYLSKFMVVATCFHCACNINAGRWPSTLISRMCAAFQTQHCGRHCIVACMDYFLRFSIETGLNAVIFSEFVQVNMNWRQNFVNHCPRSRLFREACNAILLLLVKLANTRFHYILLMCSSGMKHSLFIWYISTLNLK